MRSIKLSLIALLFGTGTPLLSAQSFVTDTVPDGLSLSAEIGGRAATGAVTPFWMANGQGGRRSLVPNAAFTDLTVSYAYTLGIHRFSAVAETVVETGFKPVFRLRQAGFRYELPWIRLSLGALDYLDPLELSPQTSGKMMLSNNAMPIPMALFQTNGFLDIPWTNGWLQTYLDFSAGRFVEEDYLLSAFPGAAPGAFTLGSLWHHKTLYFRIGKKEAAVPLRLTFGGTHAAIWGGRHYGFADKNPSSLRDFARIVLGKSGGDDATQSDQTNALGDQFGQYLVMLDYTTPSAGTFSLYHHHIFEDKSGVEWSNGADGLFGLLWTAPSDTWGVKNVTLEYATTMNQSGIFHIIKIERPNGEGRGGGNDSYYLNSEYRTGARYLGMNIGSPLLVGMAYKSIPEYTPHIDHTRIQAWHFGISGTILPTYGTRYEAKATLLTSFGSMNVRFTDPLHSFYGYLRVRQPLPWVEGLSLGAELGADFGNVTPKTFGGALSLRYDL